MFLKYFENVIAQQNMLKIVLGCIAFMFKRGGGGVIPVKLGTSLKQAGLTAQRIYIQRVILAKKA